MKEITFFPSSSLSSSVRYSLGQKNVAQVLKIRETAFILVEMKQGFWSEIKDMKNMDKKDE